MMSKIIDPWPPGISSLINEEDKSELNFFLANLRSRLLSMKMVLREWDLDRKRNVTNLGEGTQTFDA